jgi:hypothetical protein
VVALPYAADRVSSSHDPDRPAGAAAAQPLT